mmetsp:Transcript_48675/g.89760  ORF Transcript_48675/g.89760 Transcript_48675/m.89760 type:complete len:868 (+) Transcript_48675:84-2687(+)
MILRDGSLLHGFLRGPIALAFLLLLDCRALFPRGVQVSAVALRVNSEHGRSSLHHLAKGHSGRQLHAGRRSHSHHLSKEKLKQLHEAVVRQDGGPAPTVEDALDVLPNRVAELFGKFQSTPTLQAGQDVIEQLNVVYEKAMTQKDLLTIDCDVKRDELKQDVRKSRLGLMQIEGQLTALVNRMASVQEGVDQSLAEIEVLRQQYEHHRSLCSNSEVQQKEELPKLENDIPLAKELAGNVSKLCTSATSSPPALLECTFPDGTYLTTFAETDLQESVGLLGGLPEKLMSLTLERALRSSATSTSLLGIRSSHRRVAQNASLVSRHRHKQRIAHGLRASRQRSHESKASHKHKRERQHRRHLVPLEYCVAATTKPSCPAFLDALATFVGGVQDLTDELKQKAANQQEQCQRSLEAYDKQVDDLKRQADDGSVALANAVAEQGQLTVIRNQRRLQVQDISSEADSSVAQCTEQLHDLNATLCSARTLRKEIATALGTDQAASLKFIGDCVVGEWIRGTCSTRCGAPGLEVLSREVVLAPHGKDHCPALVMNRTCGDSPCPVDGKLGPWEVWTPCSRACGGGTRSRHRAILQHPENGGLPLAETQQQEVCNQQPCDQDCELAQWSEWSNCSKACNHGHRLRERTVVSNALGEGTCPDATSSQRRESIVCATKACASSPLPKCSSAVDLVLLLDESGSVTEGGFNNMKSLASLLVERMQLGAELAKLGVITFGSEASQQSALVADAAAVTSAVTSATYAGTNTDTAQALAVSRKLLEKEGRVDTPSAVLIFTDGMPVSAMLTTDEANRLHEQGARVMILAGGRDLSKEALLQWASWPQEENIVKIASFRELDEGRKAEVITDIIANLCPKLA